MPYSMTVPGQNCECCQQKGPDCDPCMKCYPRTICATMVVKYKDDPDCEECCTEVKKELIGKRTAVQFSTPENVAGATPDLDPEFYIEDYIDRFQCKPQNEVVRTTDELIQLRRCDHVYWKEEITCGEVTLDVTSGVAYLDNVLGLTGCYYIVFISGFGYYFSSMGSTGSGCNVPGMTIVIPDYSYCVTTVTLSLRTRDRHANPYFGYCDAACVHCGCLPNAICWEYYKIDKTSDPGEGSPPCGDPSLIFGRGIAILENGAGSAVVGEGYDEFGISFSINSTNCYFQVNGQDLFSIDAGVGGEAIKCGFPQITTSYIMFEDENTLEYITLRESPCETVCFEPECAGHCPAFFDCSTLEMQAEFTSDCEYWDGHSQPVQNNQASIPEPYAEGLGCGTDPGVSGYWGYTQEEWDDGGIGDECVVFCHSTDSSSVEGEYDVEVECYSKDDGPFFVRFSLRLYYPPTDCPADSPFVDCSKFLLDVRVYITLWPYNCSDAITHTKIPVSACSCSPVFFEFNLPDGLLDFAPIEGPDAEDCCILLCGGGDSNTSIRFTA